MEDLDENPLYRAFLSKFLREFKIACKMSCLIAIPKSETLHDIEIDQIFASSHILLPSRLLKMHFTPLQVGQCVDIEIEGRKLIVNSRKKTQAKDKFTVNILAEEVGYNSSNKEYRTLLIDRPLVDATTRPLIKSILSPRSSTNRYQLLKTKPPKPLTNHDDCSKYLESISQKLTMELEMDVKRLQDNYIILSQYLDDAAKRIKHLVENYIAKYELLLIDNIGTSLCNSIKHAVKLSLENYVIHLMHGKLLASICNQCEKDDKVLIEKFSKIRKSKLTICQLGAQLAFADFVLSEDLICELRRLSYYQSPLALVSSLIKLVGLISESLNQSVKFRNLKGDVDFSGDKVTICSDDLIASFVYSLAQVSPDYLYSISKYLDTFSWSSSAKDQAAYYTATFQIVIQYIMSFSPDETWIPECSKTNTSQNRTRKLDTTKHSPSKPSNTNRFVDSLDSRVSNKTGSSISSVSSGNFR